MATRLCHGCNERPVVGRRATTGPPHPNTLYCAVCRAARLRAPLSQVTADQGAAIDRLRHTMPRTQIAQTVGVSHAAVNRYLREQGVTSKSNAYPPEVVAAVCTAYEQFGKHRTQELFPDVNLRAIVERHKQYAPRQIRWTADQLIECARMAGLVSPTAQARFFGRPNAFGGSIRAVWAKRFQCSPHDLNGLAAHLAWSLCTPGTPAVLVPYQPTVAPKAMVLWLDLAQHLRPDVDPVIRHAIQGLARFQAWLHGHDDAQTLSAFIQERNAYDAQACTPA